MHDDTCQTAELPRGSEQLQRFLGSKYFRLEWELKTHGLLATIRWSVVGVVGKILGSLSLERKIADSHPAVCSDGILHLRPGEFVEVKSEAEILKTLDGEGRHGNCIFMSVMKKYCGQKLRVYKRVERIRLESTGEIRKVKNTVLLEGSICDGGGVICDRSCFFFWREAWLKRVDDHQLQ